MSRRPAHEAKRSGGVYALGYCFRVVDFGFEYRVHVFDASPD